MTGSPHHSEVSREGAKRLVLLEALPILLAILTAIRILYELRSISLIGHYLSTIVAIILVYVPVIHVSFRKLSLRFFEKTWTDVLKSLKTFALLSLAIFPAFLIINHSYQGALLDQHIVAQPLSAFPPLDSWLVQIFLVAFPEEFFYRGYLQTLISRHWHKKINILGSPSLSMTVAVPMTSFLFAFSHSVIALQWWHFAIFFPGLVFGWLREKTGGLVAPILFHALSNLVVYWIGNAYK